MVQVSCEQRGKSLRHSILAAAAGKHLSRTERAARFFMLAAVFVMMALPILIDWLR